MGVGLFSLVTQLNHKTPGALGGPSLLFGRACQPWLHRGDSPKAVYATCILLLRWDSKCFPGSLNFSFPVQIDHTEVDAMDNRQNGRPATNLPAPKSAVSHCPHLRALAHSLPEFGKGEVTPCLSTSLLTSHFSESAPGSSQ